MADPLQIDLDLSQEISLPITFDVDGDISVDATLGESISLPVSFANVSQPIGSMAESTYDPTGVAADVFDLSNHYGTADQSEITIDGGLL
jgi:hypothetical protein